MLFWYGSIENSNLILKIKAKNFFLFILKYTKAGLKNSDNNIISAVADFLTNGI